VSSSEKEVGASSCAKSQSPGSLSVRQRKKRAAWRKRSPWSFSKLTSQTNSGRTWTQDRSLAPLQRLGEPGGRPWPKLSPPTRGCSLASPSRLSAAENEDV